MAAAATVAGVVLGSPRVAINVKSRGVKVVTCGGCGSSQGRFSRRHSSNFGSLGFRAVGRKSSRVLCSSDEPSTASTPPAPVSTSSSANSSSPTSSLEKDVAKLVTKTATTFAPRASGKQNPAQKGTLLYSIFEWQSWVSIVIGGLLSYNIIFPSDEPSIARLLGMWSIWIFAVPSLRARDCSKEEKDALNILFLLIPLINVTLPIVWRSFPAVFTADCVTMAAIYYWKMVAAPSAGESESKADSS